MRKQAGQSAPDQRWSADRQPKCRVEDISSDSNHSPETVTGGVFQFSITKIWVKRNLFKVPPTKISLQWAVVAAQLPLMEGKQDGKFPSAGFRANRHSWVKTNLISSIRPRRRSRPAIRQWSQHWRAIQSLKRYCSVLERRRGSDYNNLSLKAATCRRFKVEDETELESQTLKGEKGRKRERWRGCDSNVSVCLILVPF